LIAHNACYLREFTALIVAEIHELREHVARGEVSDVDDGRRLRLEYSLSSTARIISSLEEGHNTYHVPKSPEASSVPSFQRKPPALLGRPEIETPKVSTRHRHVVRRLLWCVCVSASTDCHVDTRRELRHHRGVYDVIGLEWGHLNSPLGAPKRGWGA